MKYAIKLHGMEYIYMNVFIRFYRYGGDVSYRMESILNGDCLLDEECVARRHYKRIVDNNPMIKLSLLELTDIEAFKSVLDGKERGYEVVTNIDRNNQPNV